MSLWRRKRDADQADMDAFYEKEAARLKKRRLARGAVSLDIEAAMDRTVIAFQKSAVDPPLLPRRYNPGPVIICSSGEVDHNYQGPYRGEDNG